MAHPIEEKLASFIAGNDVDLSNLKALSEVFGVSLQEAILKRFTPTEDRAFRLRMSNIGLPLRQLCLQRDNPRPKNHGFTLSGFYGDMLEHLMVLMLKASGVNVEVHNKETEVDVNGTIIKGTLDVIIDGKVYDIKSASAYSYDNKFESYKSLEDSDSFGYLAQGFGYGLGENLPFGGWIVIHKAKGQYKVVPVPMSIQTQYKDKYFKEFDMKIKHIHNNLPAPPCGGVIDEWFNKKRTGNKILGRGCEWCDYKKEVCHPELQTLPSLVSAAKEKPIRHYIEIGAK